jgi:hypothetical protein
MTATELTMAASEAEMPVGCFMLASCGALEAALNGPDLFAGGKDKV